MQEFEIDEDKLKKDKIIEIKELDANVIKLKILDQNENDSIEPIIMPKNKQRKSLSNIMLEKCENNIKIFDNVIESHNNQEIFSMDLFFNRLMFIFKCLGLKHSKFIGYKMQMIPILGYTFVCFN